MLKRSVSVTRTPFSLPVSSASKLIVQQHLIMAQLKFIIFTIYCMIFYVTLCSANVEYEIFDCLFEQQSLDCIKNTTDKEVDQMEVEIMGRKSSVTFSKVLEQSGSFLVDTVFGENVETQDELIKNIANVRK